MTESGAARVEMMESPPMSDSPRERLAALLYEADPDWNGMRWGVLPREFSRARFRYLAMADAVLAAREGAGTCTNKGCALEAEHLIAAEARVEALLDGIAQIHEMTMFRSDPISMRVSPIARALLAPPDAGGGA
jgi:hypothetical protein